ncbi:hypothetical protein T484DRAFT_3642136, partial [Baffinella frigidus]
MALVQGLASTPLALSDDARSSIGDIEDSKTRPGTPLSPEPARVVRVFTRRKLGEVERTADQAIVVSVEKILHFQNMPLKDASKELVRTCQLTLAQSNHEIPRTLLDCRRGLSSTAFKGVCRRLGIMAWPFKTAKDTRNVKRARASATPDDSNTAAPKTPPSAFPTPPPSPTPPHCKRRKSMQSAPSSEVSTPQSYKSIEHNRLPPAVLRLTPPARPSTATPAHPPFHRPPSPRALGAHVLAGWVSEDARPSMATPAPAGAVRGFPVVSHAAACDAAYTALLQSGALPLAPFPEANAHRAAGAPGGSRYTSAHHGNQAPACVYLKDLGDSQPACDARGVGCDAYSALNGSDAAYNTHHGSDAIAQWLQWQTHYGSHAA